MSGTVSWALDTSVLSVASAPLERVVGTETYSLDAGFGPKGFVVSGNKHTFILAFS